MAYASRSFFRTLVVLSQLPTKGLRIHRFPKITDQAVEEKCENYWDSLKVVNLQHQKQMGMSDRDQFNWPALIRNAWIAEGVDGEEFQRLGSVFIVSAVERQVGSSKLGMVA